MEKEPIHTSFGLVTILDNIVSIDINEGITFKSTDLEELFGIYDTFFPNEKFGYLSNRVNDYSIDLSPELYKAVHPNLVAIAVVCYSEVSYENANFEKTFYKNSPFKVFTDFDDAVKWLKSWL